MFLAIETDEAKFFYFLGDKVTDASWPLLQSFSSLCSLRPVTHSHSDMNLQIQVRMCETPYLP